MSKSIKTVIREPLLHFLVLGALLFAAYSFLNPNSGPSGEEIIVSAGQVESLATSFAKVWQRPPTEEELRGLVDQHIREEILSREAIKLGLDRDDTVIRRRLQQKMEFVTEDLLASREPTEEELATYLADHPEAFREEPRFSFVQVYLNPDKRGERLQSDAAQLLVTLNTGSGNMDPASAGDSTLLPEAMQEATLSRIEYTFGTSFANQLARVELGEWSGPIPSGYGLHLVRILEHQEGRLPELAEVRDAVQREWQNARRVDSSRRFYNDLKEQYQVSVQWPDGAESTGTGKETAAR